jgi:tetratricopeptide (TPR) repeat protein
VGIIEKHKPHVFVVMPFGRREVPPADAAKAPREVDFDAVYALLLRPALEQAGCAPFRADQEPGAGDIRTDMFFELVTADFVLADISVLDANVFYELGARQGVAARGVVMVHGGHSKRPFDIAPDRTFDYDGGLFVHPIADPARPAIGRAVAQLATILEKVIAKDAMGSSSPVYNQLPGLEPPDPRDIESARARYVGAAFDEIADRVAVARKRGLAGDILTLAEEAPNALHRARLLHRAGKTLFDLQHFQLAIELLEEVVELDPNDADAESFIGIALNRLGKPEDAEVRLQNLIRRAQGHDDAQGALGRVYEDEWRQTWEHLGTIAERKEAAAAHAEIAEKSIERSARALRCDQRSYYDGIRALGLAKVLEHVGRPTRLSTAIVAAAELVSIVAQHEVEDTSNAGDEASSAEHIWALATCGELALLSGDAKSAGDLYARAATAPGVTPFALDSMMRGLEMYERVEFGVEATKAARRSLERGRKLLPPSPASYRYVLFASGHMIDLDGRAKPRFPRSKEAAVKERIEQCVAKWKMGPEDLLVCGAARGADLLVAEACLAKGCRVVLHVAKDEGEYLLESVDLPNSDWRERYFAVKGHRLTTVRFQPEELGTIPSEANVHARNNRWCMNTAWATARKRDDVFVLLVWDEQPTGDGPGGTSHAATIAREHAGKLEIINPTSIGST